MSHAPDKTLAFTVTWVAGIVAGVVALTLPLGYFSIGYTALSSKLDTEATVVRSIVSRLISSAPDMWTFQQYRLTHMLSSDLGELGKRSARILDINNNVILEVGETQARPLLRRSTNLFDSGQVVGRVELSQSLRRLLLETALAAALGLALAAAVFIALRVLPLRALRRATEDLRDEKERAEVTLHSIGDAVVTTDAVNVIEYLNPVAEKLTGWRSDEVRGMPLEQIFKLINEVTGEPVDNPLPQAIREKCIVPLGNNTALVRRDGTTVAIQDNAAPILDRAGDVIGGVLVFHDVTTARNLAERVNWQAAHDALTGLVNRREFETRLDAAIASARISGKHHVVCYLDLDQFKVVNDTCGHGAGDELLKQISAVLSGRIREADTLARIGGDEFALLLDGCPMDRARLIAEDLLAAVRDVRFQWESKVFTVGASMGLAAVKPDSHKSFSDILSAADTACYAAKEQGRNRAAEYRTMDSHLAGRRREMDWVTRITSALDENRLTLYYQSYLALSQPAGNEKHVEILVRLIDEQGELVQPGSFLPAAERFNLMPAIDRWVVERVFSRYRELAAQLGGKPLICAINVSGSTINSEGFFEFVEERVRLHQLPRDVACFEITETAVINNLRRAAQFMKEMKALGFYFALDDFGAGTSSFGYLKNLPVDYLKIDGSFIRDILRDPVDRAMAETINRIGHIMGMKTVAEFVETDELIGELRSMGVDFAQGYAVAKPQPLPVPRAVESVSV